MIDALAQIFSITSVALTLVVLWAAIGAIALWGFDRWGKAFRTWTTIHDPYAAGYRAGLAEGVRQPQEVDA